MTAAGTDIIPLFRPSCSDLEVKYVTEVLRSGWWGLGPVTGELEQRFAEHVGVRYAVATNSCTTALQLACQALGVTGGEVIVPALTFASTALAPMQAGAVIRFADIDENTLCLDWEDVSCQAIDRDIRAVIPVWFGGVVGIPAVQETPAPVIEDCAHACGSENAGHIGVAACWSFHAVKNLASGDGGMVTTNDRDLADRIRRLRWCGIDRSTWDRDKTRQYSWEYDISEPGWKAHMNDITAAIALAQLERLPVLNAARRRIVLQYLDRLTGLNWLKLPRWRNDSAWHLFQVRVPAADRDDFISYMQYRGITAGVHYKPLNTFTAFPYRELPVTDRVWETLVTLPLYPDMTDLDIDRVITSVRSWPA